MTGMPLRASMNERIAPAGPAPTTQQVVCSIEFTGCVCGRISWVMSVPPSLVPLESRSDHGCPLMVPGQGTEHGSSSLRVQTYYIYYPMRSIEELKTPSFLRKGTHAYTRLVY